MAGVAELGTSLVRAHASVDALSKSVDRCKWLAEEILRKLEKMVGDPEPVAFWGTTSATATPPPTSTTSTPPGAPPPGSRAVSGTPANLFDGAQKVFEGMSLRENEQFRGFLSVRGHRIGKARRSRSSGAAGAASARARMARTASCAQRPRPRITTPTSPLKDAPTATSSTTSTDLMSSTTPVRCVRPRPGAVAASATSNRAGVSRRSSACRGHDRPHKTGAPVPSAASASTRVMGPPPLEGGPTAGRAALSPAPPPQRTPPSSSKSSSPSVVLSTEEGVIFTMSLKCSMLCRNRDNNLLNNIPATSPRSNTNKNHSFEYIEQRYITANCNHAYPIEMLVTCLAAKVFESKGHQYSVVLWPPFSGCSGWMLVRQPWPPPILCQFRGTTLLIGCSTVNRVFDRGKSTSAFTLAISLLGTINCEFSIQSCKWMTTPPISSPPLVLSNSLIPIAQRQFSECYGLDFFALLWTYSGLFSGYYAFGAEMRPAPWLSFRCYPNQRPSQGHLPCVLSRDHQLLHCGYLVAICTAEVQLKNFLLVLFAKCNSTNYEQFLVWSFVLAWSFGEWPDHEFSMLFEPGVHFQPNILFVQSFKLPSIFQQPGFAQQESMSIQWRFLWSSLSCYASMSKLILSRTNSPHCGTLLRRVVAEIVRFLLLLVTALILSFIPLSAAAPRDIPKFSHLNLIAFADQIIGNSCAKVPCSQVQLIGSLVTVIGVLVSYTKIAVLHNFVEFLDTYNCKLQKDVEDFHTSANCPEILKLRTDYSSNATSTGENETEACAKSVDYDLLGSELKDLDRENTLDLLTVDSSEVRCIWQCKDDIQDAPQIRMDKVSCSEIAQWCIEEPPQFASAVLNIRDCREVINSEPSEGCCPMQLLHPGGLYQRLEGKPHFKRWGMSWTGPSLAQWASRDEEELAMDKRKGETGQEGYRTEQTRRLQPLSLSISRTLAACSPFPDSLLFPLLYL